MRRPAVLPLGTMAALLAACGGAGDPAPSAPDTAGPAVPERPVPVVPAESVWREVATASGGTCAVDGTGALRCVSVFAPGGTSVWHTPLPTGERLHGLSMRDGAVCALNPDGVLRCGNFVYRDIVPATDDGVRFRQVAGDAFGGCALATDGTPYCWFRPEAVTPESPWRMRPTPLPGAPRLVSISLGGAFLCGLTAAGDAYCWSTPGADANLGQLGNGARAPSLTPVRVRAAARFVSLSAGVTHACALTAEGEAYCWGGNQGEQLGVDRTARPDCFGEGLGYPQYGCSTPQRVSTTLRFREVRAGFQHSCALTDDGTAYCWGANTARVLGVLTVPGGASCRMGAYVPCTAEPVAVSGGLTFATLGPASGMTQCGVTAAGRVYCWGNVRANGLPDAGLALDGYGSASPVPFPDPPR